MEDWTNPAATDPTAFSRARFHDTIWRHRFVRCLGLEWGPHGYGRGTPGHTRVEYTHTRPRATRWWLDDARGPRAGEGGKS